MSSCRRAAYLNKWLERTWRRRHGSCGVAGNSPAAFAHHSAAPLASVIVMKTREDLVKTYDRLAPEFARQFCDELKYKQFDRDLLERFAREVPEDLPVCDIGCGPGHVAAYLHNLRLKKVIGIDLSPGMIDQARSRYAMIDFRVGDMLDLDMPADSIGGIVAFYAIIHLEHEMLSQAFSEMYRVLCSDGLVLLSFHRGQGCLHEDSVLGTSSSFDCTLFEPDEVQHALERVRFTVTTNTTRDPYDIEYPTKRVYVVSQKRAG
jgi:ubiquinone/menaquinone biosynthesis C-methylase UbiE